MNKETLIVNLKNFGSTFRKIITNKFFIIFFVCFLLFIGWKTLVALNEAKKQYAKYMQPTLVEVTEIKTQNIKKSFEFSGRIEAQYSVDIIARVQGFLQKSYFKEGDFVKKGQLLFLIEPNEYEIAVKNAQAAYNATKASLTNAEKNLIRAKELVKQDFVSKSYYDEALAQRDLYKGNLDVNRAQLAQAKLNLSYTRIVAPVDGKMGKILITQGNLVNLSKGAIAKLISTNPIYVSFNLKSEDYLKFKKADPSQDVSNTVVNLKLSDGSNYKQEGKIEFIDNAVDTTSGTITMRATFENPEGLLVPGDYITITLTPINPRKEILVPMESVQDSADGFFVYVVEESTVTDKKKHTNEQKVAKLRHIKATEQYQGYWIVDEGLKDGDIVVTQGIKELRDGKNIKIKETQNTAQLEVNSTDKENE